MALPKFIEILKFVIQLPHDGHLLLRSLKGDHMDATGSGNDLFVKFEERDCQRIDISLLEVISFQYATYPVVSVLTYSANLCNHTKCALEVDRTKKYMNLESTTASLPRHIRILDSRVTNILCSKGSKFSISRAQRSFWSVFNETGCTVFP